MTTDINQPGQEPQPRPTGFRFATWCLKAVGFILIMGAGALYGVGAYKYFSELSVTGGSGQMLLSFLVGVPLVIGILVGYIAKRNKVAGFTGASLLSTISIGLFVFAAGTLLREGTICIVMAIPIFIVLAIIGAIIGVIAGKSAGSQGPKLLSVAILIPALVAPFENGLPQQDDRQVTNRSIYIAAAPEVIWQHINTPLDIKPSELQTGFAYRIGVPYPIEARTTEGRVGGRRTLKWERGVSFEEVITAWKPNQFIAWKYDFQASSFPPGSLDDHILIGGRYFNLEDTSYTLSQEGNGTRLSISVGTRVTTNFNGYAGMWARFLVGDTAETILQFYKHRSEAGTV